MAKRQTKQWPTEKEQRDKQDELWANAHLWYPRIYVQCV